MITFSEENYLKAIFHLEKLHVKGVPTNAVAESMDTKASSSTDMIKRLSEKKLCVYKKYQGVKLSALGRSHAVNVIRKHRLWECFLVEKLDFSWDEVHEIAEQLEHIESEKLIDKLDEFLGYPKTDPHGDPIPDEQGNFSKIDKVLLLECGVDESGVFVGVRDSSPAFLQYLDKNNISLGVKIKVLHKEEFDQSVQIEVEGNEVTVSSKTASNIFIKL
ncbi:metal-dependent transcriptional regulator [Gillisia sp. M10.2A]|uniref:Transcriptional regulator MntR n=1 Tax=Gillisia lutea TaxID=2909668 RepID=A0ABS9EES1_9FLAO|nr:metal-dependent transcriptional regulator [Gillisia lutea]MCF4100762.1 metal-dependent transcriptional regulator [Gillisia lutea]